MAYKTKITGIISGVLFLVVFFGGFSVVDSFGQKNGKAAKDEQPLGKSGVLKIVTFKSKRYFVCTVNTHEYRVGVYNKLADGKGVYDFNSLYLANKQDLVLAVNGGMYDENRHAIGLLVAEGKQQHKINTVSGGTGNFTMKPNGVFYIDGKHDAHVATTPAYMDHDPKPLYATQSGPMLLIDGEFHPAFTEHSVNLNIRNGVGVDGKGNVVLVTSEDRVNFYEFAELYRDRLKCNNALYLDGAICQYFAPELEAAPKEGVKLGPIICVMKGGSGSRREGK